MLNGVMLDYLTKNKSPSLPSLLEAITMLTKSGNMYWERKERWRKVCPLICASFSGLGPRVSAPST